MHHPHCTELMMYNGSGAKKCLKTLQLAWFSEKRVPAKQKTLQIASDIISWGVTPFQETTKMPLRERDLRQHMYASLSYGLCGESIPGICTLRQGCSCRALRSSARIARLSSLAAGPPPTKQTLSPASVVAAA